MLENPDLLDKVQQAAVQISHEIQAEATNVPYHAERGALAMQVLLAPDRWGKIMLSAILGDIANVTSGAVTDAIMLTSLRAIWTALSVVKTA